MRLRTIADFPQLTMSLLSTLMCFQMDRCQIRKGVWPQRRAMQGCRFEYARTPEHLPHQRKLGAWQWEIPRCEVGLEEQAHAVARDCWLMFNDLSMHKYGRAEFKN